MLGSALRGRRFGRKVRTAFIVSAAVGLFVAAGGGATAAEHKPLPVPSFSLAATHSTNGIVVTGGFRLKGKPLKTTYHWTEQEFDASGNPLPLDRQVGYTGFHQLANGDWVPQTTAVGTSAGLKGFAVPLRIPGANKAVLVVTASTPAAKTHKSGRTTRARTFTMPLGGYTAVGTSVPHRVLQPNYAGYFLGWDTTFSVAETGSPTVRAPDPWNQGIDFGALTACHWTGMGHESPTSPLPANDPNYAPPAVVTGLIVYPIKLVCSNAGYWAIPYITVWSLPAGSTSFTGGCYFTMEGVTSFTLPPAMGGQIGFFVNLLTKDSNDHDRITNGNELVQTDYGSRTSGADICQTMPSLPRFH